MALADPAYFAYSHRPVEGVQWQAMWRDPPAADRTSFTDELFRDFHKEEFERRDKHDTADSFFWPQSR
jgi:hypothetical protein